MNQELQLSANCPECGEVELAAEQLWLVLTGTGSDHYDFRCPRCATFVRYPADEAIVALLAQLVSVEELDVPAEALESHIGSPLTLDDRIDLMLSVDAGAAVTSADSAACGLPG